LEEWICRNPELLGDRLLVIDRQRNISGVGQLDLLAIDEAGTLVVIELKRDRTPREAVAQVLDYASWLDSATEKTRWVTCTTHRPIERGSHPPIRKRD
jgi:RecB family endonuclease NucS